MKTEFYEAYKNISEHFTLLVDTREKQNGRYRRRMEAFEALGVHPLRQHLDVGDYSAIVELPNGRTFDFSGMVSIERKMDTEELLTSFGKRRDAFEAELLRAKDMKCRLYVVTEGGSYEDILSGNFKTDISVASAKGTYHAFEQRHNVHFIFISPNSFPVFVHETLRRHIMDYLCKNYPNGEIL